MRIHLQNIFEPVANLHTGDYNISFVAGCCPCITLTMYGHNSLCSFTCRYRVPMDDDFVGEVHRIYDDASFLKVALKRKDDFDRGMRKHFNIDRDIKAWRITDAVFKDIEKRLANSVPTPLPVQEDDDIPF